MRYTLFLVFIFISTISFGQKIEWIPFNWEGDSVSGKYLDKLAITIPITLDNLPNKFKMQLDLGATVTIIYGNSIKPYLETYAELKNKVDTALKFNMQSQTNFKIKNLELKLGCVNFGERNIELFKGFGDNISNDSIHSKSEKLIGSIAPDLFKNQFLIIDYPLKRICLTSELPKQFSKTQFRQYKEEEGRIKIPITINGKSEDVMFDTGSSLFALITTPENANEISNKPIVDSLKISSWGDYYMVYGQTITSKVKFGRKQLSKANVYFDNQNKLSEFYKEEKIWGITGNTYFLNNIVIIDYKNNRFGVY